MASVKPNTSTRPGSDFNRTPGGGLHAINVTLREMILFAYDIRDQQLIGGPGWMGSDRYDVLAKPSQNDNPAGAKRSFDEDFRAIRLKMRALLADRFQLAIHTETREMPIYVLVAAKNGPHLEASKSDGLTINNRRGLVLCKKVSMKAFAESSLTYRMGRTVVDKTGISGEFDFELKFREDQDVDSTDPDFLTAMREQLGLVLHSEKGPVQVMVVDDAKKASAN
ncbi:MAG TPA: TIGR03435 family protein [Candidatus Solibacter sp.]